MPAAVATLLFTSGCPVWRNNYAPGTATASNRLRLAAERPNVLVLRIQPDEGIALRIGAKQPGPTMRVETVKMDFRYSEHFGEKTPDAYERLLLDSLNGDPTLFAREDMIDESWRVVEPILVDYPPVEEYEPGSWGPASAKQLVRGYLQWPGEPPA
jgi:glucose-6-phosphate 1-dehydrogenase